MSDLRTAAQQALEAWEHINKYGFVLADYEGPMEQAITALKAALEQPEQEPVAWMTPGQDLHLNNSEGFRFSDWTPLFTHPPRREWRSLSEEEIKNAVGASAEFWATSALWIKSVARAAEAALKEKNHG
jgi:hypothetical protein